MHSQTDHSPAVEEIRATGRRDRGLKLWLPAIAIAAVSAAALQALQHRFFMELPMVWYHVLGALVHAVVIVVPVALYLLWVREARRTRQALEWLRASEALREDLTRMLVHDLKSPLLAASSSLQLVLRRWERGKRQLEERDVTLLRNALDGQLRAARMVHDLLDIARAEASGLPLHRQAVDIAAVVRDAARTAAAAAEAKDVNVEIRAQPAPTAHADPDIVQRVVENLLDNAIRFSPAGETVTVTVGPEADGVVVCVRDRGPGIPAEAQQRIFDKFAQAHDSKGSGRRTHGLGLAFCKIAVEAHGGRIWVDSQPDAGSAFCFWLPAARADADEQRGQRPS